MSISLELPLSQPSRREVALVEGELDTLLHLFVVSLRPLLLDFS